MIRAAEAWPLPEEVATKSFTSVRRGFHPAEVRDYLARLAVVVTEAIDRVTVNEDKLAILGAREDNEADLRSAVGTLQAQVEDLTNRVTLATAMRTEALARVAELEQALAAVDAPPAQQPRDELDRAASELAQLLREARIRAAHIRADAEREARLIIEGAQRERRTAREQQDREYEQAALAFREQLAAICQDAENRVAAAHSEAGRTLADAEEHAARTVELATFQARRLVDNAGDFTAIWLREAQQLRELGHLEQESEGAPAQLSAADALAAFQASMDATDLSAPGEPDPAERTRDIGGTDHDARQTEDTEHTANAEHAAELLDEADKLLSIAEVLRRAEPGAQNQSPNGTSAARAKPARAKPARS